MGLDHQFLAISSAALPREPVDIWTWAQTQNDRSVLVHDVVVALIQMTLRSIETELPQNRRRAHRGLAMAEITLLRSTACVQLAEHCERWAALLQLAPGEVVANVGERIERDAAIAQLAALAELAGHAHRDGCQVLHFGL